MERSAVASPDAAVPTQPPDSAEWLGCILDALEHPLRPGRRWSHGFEPEALNPIVARLAENLQEVMLSDPIDRSASGEIQDAAMGVVHGLARMDNRGLRRAFPHLLAVAKGLSSGAADRSLNFALSMAARELDALDGDAGRCELRQRCVTALKDSISSRQLKVSAALAAFGRDDSSPLECLAKRYPGAIQTLDRGAGSITVEWPTSANQAPCKTVLRVPGCPPDGSIDQLRRQDAAIRLLDRFGEAPLHLKRKLWTFRPPEISTDGHDIHLGRLKVATVTPGGWVVDPDSVIHAKEALQPYNPDTSVPRAWMSRAREWPSTPFPSPRPREPLAMRGERPLRLVIQLAPDKATLSAAVAQRLRYPAEAVHIQADRFGGHRILGGAELLRNVGTGGPIKVELAGHGGRHARSDECLLSDYTAKALAERLALLMRRLRLDVPIQAVNLTACSLESPVFTRSFAAEFLAAAHDLGALSPCATVTAYAAPLAFKNDERTGEKLTSRETFIGHRASPAHAPGMTLIYTRDPVSGAILRQDKYAETDREFHPIDERRLVHWPRSPVEEIVTPPPEVVEHSTDYPVTAMPHPLSIGRWRT